MIGYRHYIRLDENNKIIKTFSDWQGEEILSADIEVTNKINEADSGLRQFNLNLFKNFKLCLKWNKEIEQIEELTEDELYPLEELKIEKIRQLKQNATGYINSNIPEYKQRNASLGVSKYHGKKEEYVKFIEEAIAKCDVIEGQINSANSKEELERIDILLDCWSVSIYSAVTAVEENWSKRREKVISSFIYMKNMLKYMYNFNIERERLCKN